MSWDDRFQCLVAVSVLLLASILSPATAATDDESLFDCGTLSLYTLMRIEGKATDLHQISSRLPTPPANGFSMRELRDAARGLGFDLRGVRLHDDGRFGDEPALVFLNRSPHGHFVVVRPVGHTGKIVQVFDSVRSPVTAEIDDLRRSPEWTGLALVPARPNRITFLSTTIILVLCLFVFINHFYLRR